MERTPLEIFRIVATEFSTIPDATVEVRFDLYSPLISERKFGDLYSQALAYLTAHYMKMSGMGTDEVGAGTIADSLRLASVSEGETSVNFGTSQQTNLQIDAEYSLTQYGLMFLTLKRLVSIPIVSAGESYGMLGNV